LRLVALEIGLSLLQGPFRWPRVYREKQIACFDLLSLAKMYFGYLSRDLRANRHRRERLHISHISQFHRDILRLGLSHYHRHRRRRHFLLRIVSVAFAEQPLNINVTASKQPDSSKTINNGIFRPFAFI